MEEQCEEPWDFWQGTRVWPDALTVLQGQVWTPPSCSNRTPVLAGADWLSVTGHPNLHPTSPPAGTDMLDAWMRRCGGVLGSACCCYSTQRKLLGRLRSQCPWGGEGADVCILFCTSLTTRRPLSPARHRALCGIPLPPGCTAPFSPGC